MKKIFFIFFVTTIVFQFDAKCVNCNKTTSIVQSVLGFTKPKPVRPDINNSTTELNNSVSPYIKPKSKPKTHTHGIFNATTSVTYGSTDNGLLISTTSAGNAIIIGTTNSAGNSTSINGTVKNFVLANYSNNGILNQSFGTKGITITDIVSVLSGGAVIGSTDIPVTYAVQNNGYILVAGNSNASGINDFTFSTSAFALARYKTNGQLDTSFGTGGVVCKSLTSIPGSSSPGAGSNDYLVAMSLQTNNGNKIVVAGNSTFGFAANSFAVARYLTNGNLDTSFNSTGFNVVNVEQTFNPGNNTSNDIVTSMTILSNNKILLCGYSNYLSPNYQFTAMRFMPNGTLDTSFGNKGIVLTNINETLNTTT